MIQKSTLTPSVIATSIALIFSGNAYGQFSGMYGKPLIGSQAAAPLFLFTVQRDYRLFIEAYDDASDINGDGIMDVKYNPALKKYDAATSKYLDEIIDYYGYFDSHKCYEYKDYGYDSGSSTIKAFVPIGDATSDKKCNSFKDDSKYGTSLTRPWSGDFLNYLTTTRADALRKVLYGGKRYIDNSYIEKTKSSPTVLERAQVTQDNHAFGKEYTSKIIDGYDIADYTPLNEPQTGKRHLFANVNLGSSSDKKAPLLRIATGRSERIWDWISAETTNVASSNINGTAITPVDLNVRVVVCDNQQLPITGDDADFGYCKQYGNGNKPIGILHKYGENNLAYFGLLTGTSKNNYSGGVLRRAISSFADEINSTTGQFLGRYDNDASVIKGIVYTIDKLQVMPFSGAGNGYGSATGEKFGSSTSSSTNGNPVAEMMYEGLRYLAGQTATSDYYTGITPDSNKLSNESPALPIITSWANPYTTYSVCSKPTQIVVSDINPTFDSDQLPGSNFGSFTGKLGTLNVATLADSIWTAENLTSVLGSKIIIGEVKGSTTDAGLPTAKTGITGFSTIRGLTPEDPLWQGSYYAGAVAKYGKETDLGTMGNSAFTSIKNRTVNTTAVALSSALPRIQIPINQGLIKTTVTVVPYAQTLNGTNWAIGEFNKVFVDNIKNVTGFPTDPTINDGYPYYKLQVVFSDNTLYRSNGHDNDMDARATYEVYWDNAKSEVVVNVCADPDPGVGDTPPTSCNKDGVVGKGYSATGVTGMHLGYSISGVDIPSGESLTRLVVRNNAYVDSSGTSWNNSSCNNYGQNKCSQVTDYRHSLDLTSALHTGTFTDNFFWKKSSTISEITNTIQYKPAPAPDGKTLLLNNSTRYTVSSASSAGSFIPHDPLWYAAKYGGYIDEDGDMKFSAADTWAKSDGKTPRSYFSVTNPAQLREQIGSAIELEVDLQSSFSSLTSNSTKLETTSAIYQAKYLAKTWSGHLYAYNYANGAVNTSTPAWDAAEQIPSYDKRSIFSYRASTGTKSATGFELLWKNLNTAEIAALSSDSKRLDFLRGDNTNSGTSYRKRATDTVLGDIVNSSPVYVATEDYGYASSSITEKATYTAFLEGKSSRTPMVYVGANDGMLHGFDAGSGKELFAYVPRAILLGDNASKFNDLANKTYTHNYYVDGPITTGDYYDGTSWHTALVGTLGAGGRSVYALDISNPSSFGASNVLWEFQHPELGYVRNRPLIVRLNDGKWYAVVGNGFESFTCDSTQSPRYAAASASAPLPNCTFTLTSQVRNAKLFIISMTPDLSDGWTYGSDYFILHATDVQTATTAPSVTTGSPTTYSNGTDNGLAGPSTVNNARINVGTIYAGDLQGNVWKFDLSDKVPSNWKVAYSLYQAKDKTSVTQPITAPVTVSSKPKSKDGTVCVAVGTGRFVYEGDLSYKATQSAYGLQDQGSSITSSDKLQEYTITRKVSETTGGVTNNLVYVSNEAAASDKSGWFIDLTDPPTTTGGPRQQVGERIIQAPSQTLLRSGSLMSEFTTSIPTGDACDATGKSYVLDFDACTGEALPSPTFDLDNNATFNDVDKGTPNTGERLAGKQVGGSNGGGSGSGDAMCTAGEGATTPGCSYDLVKLSCTDGRIVFEKKPATRTDCGITRTSWRQLR